MPSSRTAETAALLFSLFDSGNCESTFDFNMSQSRHVASTEARLATLIERWHELVGQVPGCARSSGALSKFEKLLERDMENAIGLIKETKKARDNVLELQTRCNTEYQSLCNDRAKVQSDLRGMQGSIAALSSSCSQVIEELSSKDMDVAVLQNSVVNGRHRLDGIADRLDEIANAFSQPGKGLDAVSHRLSSLESRLQTVPSTDEIRSLLLEASNGDPPPAVSKFLANAEKLCGEDGMPRQAEHMRDILEGLCAVKTHVKDFAGVSAKQQESFHKAIEQQDGTLKLLETRVSQQNGSFRGAIDEVLGEKASNIQAGVKKMVDEQTVTVKESIREQGHTLKLLDDKLAQHLDAMRALTEGPAKLATCDDIRRGMTSFGDCSQVASGLMEAMNRLEGMTISPGRTAGDCDTDDGQDTAAATHKQVQDVGEKVEGLRGDMKALSTLLGSLFQTTEEDHPRKRPKVKQVSPRKAHVGPRSPLRRGSSRPGHTGGSMLGGKATTPKTPPSAPAGLDGEQSIDLRNRLGPALALLRNAAPCTEPQFWWPDAIVTDLWAVFGSSPLAAQNLEQALLKGKAKVAVWHCVKLLSDRSILIAKVLDKSGRCESGWCEARSRCLQVSLAEAGSETVQLRSVSFDRDRGCSDASN